VSKEWQNKQICELCEVIAGQSPEGKFYNTDGDGLPFYQGKKDFGEKFIKAPSTWTTQITKIARGGDILMSVRAPVGPVNFAIDEICIGRGLAAIRSGAELNRDFLFYQLLHLQPEIAGKEGAVFASINKKEIETLPIAFVPRPEQQRIVVILDEAFEAIATAKANAEKNLQNARALFESHLQSVFTQRAEGWVENRLIALTSKIGSGATPRGGEESYKLEGVSLIRSLNVHDLGFRYRRLAFIDNAQADELSNVEVQQRDVLLNITGASVARCCIVPEDVLPARVNQHVTIIRPIADKLIPDFLHFLLISRPYKDQLLQTGAEGGSTRQAITKAQIQDFSVQYPATLKEQESIVAKLDNILADTQRLESIYQQKLTALEALKKSLLNQAFTGNL
jgi:type I restriction enzyme, S subunit